MKTTVDIPDSILTELRKRAAMEKTTLRALLNTAIRQFLATGRRHHRKFKLRDGSVGGHGLAPGIREGDFQHLRDLAYEGRGA